MLTGDRKRIEYGGTIEAINPVDGQPWPLFVTPDIISHARNLGMGEAMELAYTVPQVVRYPVSVWRGLRDRHDETDRSLCYAGHPKRGHDRRTGKKFDANPGEIFLVFVNAERQVFAWRWERADDEKPQYPSNHQDRFKENLL